eukprot:867766-Amphidinium_carterae.1
MEKLTRVMSFKRSDSMVCRDTPLHPSQQFECSNVNDVETYTPHNHNTVSRRRRTLVEVEMPAQPQPSSKMSSRR